MLHDQVGRPGSGCSINAVPICTAENASARGITFQVIKRRTPVVRRFHGIVTLASESHQEKGLPAAHPHPEESNAADPAGM